MDDKIFLVSTGSYSSYRILAAFSTYRRAREYLKVVKSYLLEWEGQIESMQINRPPDQWTSILVQMRKDGFVLGTRQGVNDNDDTYWHFGKDGNLTLSIITDDIEQAIKATNELRTIILANNLWGDENGVRAILKGKEAE